MDGITKQLVPYHLGLPFREFFGFSENHHLNVTYFGITNIFQNTDIQED